LALGPQGFKQYAGHFWGFLTPGFTTAMLDHGTAQLGAQLLGGVVRSGDHGVVLAGYAL
jgi:hypothetical protein